MRTLKIAIDGRMLQQSGIGRYIRNLIFHLQQIDKHNQYFILLRKQDFDGLSVQSNFHKVLADVHWYGTFEQLKLPKLLKELRPDLVHFPHFNVPFFYKGKFIVTVHDLIHQHFSMQRATTHGPIIYKAKQAGYRIIFKNALARSAKVLVPSKFVKGQLTAGWHVNPEKVVVTPEAADEKILDLSRKSKVKSKNVLEKLNIKKQYIFYVGNAHPHKDVRGLIRVFEELKEKYPNLSLVLAGHDHYFWQKIKRDNTLPGIIYTGSVSDGQLAVLYKNAQAFVMPSLEEGFGIPLLEAMVCGCPVVSSDAGSLPEVGGKAAVYFKAGDRGDMKDKVDQVLKSDLFRSLLKAQGKMRVRAFSWEKLAKATLEVYKQCG